VVAAVPLVAAEALRVEEERRVFYVAAARV
jgi:hypothetical protein